jgi:hypothetical protein
MGRGSAVSGIKILFLVFSHHRYGSFGSGVTKNGLVSSGSTRIESLLPDTRNQPVTDFLHILPVTLKVVGKHRFLSPYPGHKKSGQGKTNEQTLQ